MKITLWTLKHNNYYLRRILAYFIKTCLLFFVYSNVSFAGGYDERQHTKPHHVMPHDRLYNLHAINQPRTEPAKTSAAVAEAGTKTAILNDLYDKLRSADTIKSAQPIADAIEELWMKSGSDTIDLLMARALLALQRKDLNIALELLDSVISIEPEYTEGWNRRAMIYFVQQDYAAALLDLRRVLAIDPNNYRAVNGLAMTLQELGQKDAAFRVYKKLLEIHPHLETAQKTFIELKREIEGQGI